MMQRNAAMQMMASSTKSVRISAFICGTFAIAMSGTYCGIYWSMWTWAQKYNTQAVTMYSGEIPAYDTCGAAAGPILYEEMANGMNMNGMLDPKSLGGLVGSLLGSVTGQTNLVQYIDTKWSIVLSFNALLYLILSISTVFLVVGTFWWPLICCGALGHCLGGCAMFACIVVTGVFRYTTEGKLCAE